MKITASKSKIEQGLFEKGFYLVPLSEVGNPEQLIGSIGKTIQRTEISENPESTRLLASNQPMGFHTDHFAANYIAWLCNSQAATGGESLLIDTQTILSQFSESSLELLKEISVKTHQVFYGDRVALPLVSNNEKEGITAVYYAPWLVNVPASPKHKKALEKFQEAINTTKPIRLLLSEGDVLLIDNHRMLHGRGGFPERSDRWLTRFWLSNSNINFLNN